MTEELKDKEILKDAESPVNPEASANSANAANAASPESPRQSASGHPSEDAAPDLSSSRASGDAVAGDTSPSAPQTPEELLAQARAEIEELKSLALYRQAEFENYRRRTIKEKADLILNGSKSAVTALLPIVDDLERALPSMQKAEDVAAVAEGVELIYQKFLKALAGLGVKQIETEGKDFDVDLHEAIAQVPGVPDEQKGRVIDCVEKGYTLNDHVIRHAKVAVGM